MIDWAAFARELSGEAPLPMTPRTQPKPPTVTVAVAPKAKRLVCRVCGRAWIDGECSFMPDDHRRFGAIVK